MSRVAAQSALNAAEKGYRPQEPLVIRCGQVDATLRADEEMVQDLVDVLYLMQEARTHGFGTVTATYQDGHLSILHIDKTINIRLARRNANQSQLHAVEPTSIRSMAVG